MNDSCLTLMVCVAVPLKCGDKVLDASVLSFLQYAPPAIRTVPPTFLARPVAMQEGLGRPPPPSQLAEGPHFMP